ncbi:MAG TPA: hypothetical protein VHL58_19820 [Thermoanaerobaculia bacterium]|nr:hypothetical protein [Thermoanaerobaculia bacterium]
MPLFEVRGGLFFTANNSKFGGELGIEKLHYLLTFSILILNPYLRLRVAKQRTGPSALKTSFTRPNESFFHCYLDNGRCRYSHDRSDDSEPNAPNYEGDEGRESETRNLGLS